MGQNEILSLIIRQIFRGNAILFVGAGFSKNAIGFDGEMPVKEGLQKIILDLMGKDEDGSNLSAIAEHFIGKYCKNNPNKINEFIEKLKDIFTCKEPQQHHIDIVSAPWRHIYTTNYDDVVEQVARKTDCRIDSFDLETPLDNTESKKYCLHINGKIDKLDKNTINTSFKLTHSSYMNNSADCFNKSPWKRRFTDDLEIASAIVFIGYSMKNDIDIEKILHENVEKIKEKVLFIQKEGEKPKMEDDTYEKYGKLLKIGAENFAEKIKEFKNSSDFNNLQKEFYLDCFDKFDISHINNAETIRENEIENFLMLGSIKECFLQRETLFCKNKPPFLIVRETILNRAIDILKEYKHIVILSDIGNGKTIFLKQLATKLAQEYRVYSLKNIGDSTLYKKDIDKIAQQKNLSYIVLDSYLRYKELVDFIFSQKYDNIKVVFSARTLDHHQFIRNNNDMAQVKSILIDTLEDKEIENFCHILNYIGGWTDSSKTNWSLERKQNYIKDKCCSQISYILVDILRAKQMADRIRDLFGDSLRNANIKRHLFVVLLLNVMDIPIGIGLLGQLLDEYDDLVIFRNDIFGHLVAYNLLSKDNTIELKSAIFSRFMLQNSVFEPQYIIQEALQLLIRIENLKKDNAQNSKYLNDVRINLFRFNFIERILPEDNKRNMLVKYYEDIKTHIPRIQHDPQYYLQYAMCFIAIQDFDRAQRYLKTAYDKAKETSYDTYKIDNQQARLHLIKAALYATNIKEAVELFLKADELLTKRHKNDIYKYKAMLYYKDFIDNRLNSFDKDTKNKIRRHCENQLIEMNDAKGFEADYKRERIYIICKEMLEKIINLLSS